jgi:hypothetical protein
MKRSLRPSNILANLPDSVHQGLNMYGVAATAAGVGTVALVQLAEARIIYTPAQRRSSAAR